MNRLLLLSLLLFVVCAGLVFAAPHERFSSFADFGNRLAILSDNFAVSDSAIYRTGYYSVDGADWQSFTFFGTAYENSASWLSTSASASLPAALQGAGEHYIIVYSCTRTSEGWDCHSSQDHPNGYWQLLIINNTLPEGTLYLVENGVVLADIVISPEAPNMVKLAADYFQKHIQDMTGAALPIRNAPGDDYDFHVYIGKSEYTDALSITSEGCRDDGFKMVSGEDYLVLLGDDEPFNDIRYTEAEWDAITGHTWKNEYGSSVGYVDSLPVYAADGRGSMNAVYAFMHDQGMRWYYPNADGIIIPNKQDITFTPMNEMINPDFGRRDLFLYYKALRYIRENTYPDSYQEHRDWLFSLRHNSLETYPLGHGINAVSHRYDSETETYLISNPEYFALLSPDYVNNIENETFRSLVIENGNRSLPGLFSYPNQDLCNEELLAENVLFVKAMIDTFNVTMISVAPGDGFTQISHSSQECLDKETPERGRSGSLSDYVWNYVNNVAWDVYEEYGNQTKILCGAYTTYMLPPLQIDDPRGMAPNVVAGIARSRTSYTNEENKQFYNDLVNDWVNLLPSGEVYMFDYYLHNWVGTDTQAVPFYHPHIISEDLKFLKGKSNGAFIEVWANNYQWTEEEVPWDSFVATSLNVYILSRMWWDADQDVDVLLEEYYDLYYGPAREEMKALVEYAEKNSFYSTTNPWVISDLRELAEQALAVAEQDSNPVYARRVNEVLKLINSDYQGDEMTIDSCQDLNITNMVYTLTQDVSSGGTCFNIDADGVTLDCAGHTITYSIDGIRADDSAIYNQEFFTQRGDYFTMKNCTIQDGSYLEGNTTGAAIELSNADFCIIEDVVINTSGVGIYSGSSMNNQYVRNTIHSYEGNAFSGTISPSQEPGYYNILDGNDFYSVEGNGIKLYYLDNVTLTNNVFASETIGGLSTYQVTNLHEENNTIIDG